MAAQLPDYRDAILCAHRDIFGQVRSWKVARRRGRRRWDALGRNCKVLIGKERFA